MNRENAERKNDQDGQSYKALRLVARLVAVIFVVPATFYFVFYRTMGFWLLASLPPRPEQYGWAVGAISLVSGIIALACAIGAGWYVWANFKPGHHGPFSSTILGAVLLGGSAFTLGFFGPIIFAPEANQGPLLGFIFGPLGFVLGALAGFLYWLIRGRRTPR